MLKSVLLGIGLVHLLYGSAAADEAWTCRFTEARLRPPGGGELLFHQADPFVLRLKAKVVSILVTPTSGQTFTAVSYGLVENSGARLVAASRFDRKSGAAVMVSFRLDKKSGRFIQTGSDHRQTNTGICSKRLVGILRRTKPPIGGAHARSGSRLEAPLPGRTFSGKRGA